MSFTIPELPDLPLSGYREAFEQALPQGPLLLEAEPGAGKSTLAPLWALASAPGNQAVWLIQPRILAARALAWRLAALLGEEPGKTLGYQVPFERRMGKNTRLLVITPGILLQHLLHNPSLEGVATVMLDEVHERSVDQDTAWAWLQEARILRDDLQLVLMSATPDPALRRQLAQCLAAPGRCFPVSVEYQAAPARQGRPLPLAGRALEEQVLAALASVADSRARTVLIFLPGWRAIEACARALGRAWPDQPVYRLHSRVPDVEQRRALDPASGPRVILATNIAETSLTIADVTLVVDSGLVRKPSFEQRTGISRLHSRRVSRASADQRRGRAGRVAPGHCIRLWPRDEPLAAADLPEIRATDYLPLALRLAHWGSPADDLPWLEAPNPMALAGARELLRQWRHLSSAGQVTDAGRQVSELGTHPRLAALLQSQGDVASSSLLDLALALHFTWEPPDDVDNWLASAAREASRNNHWRQQRQRWLQVLEMHEDRAWPLEPQSLAWAFRDRIGYRQDSGRYRLNSGISVAPDIPLESDWAVFPQVMARGRGHRGPGWALNLDEVTQRELSEPRRDLIHGRRGWQERTQWHMGGVLIGEDRKPLSADAVPAALVAHISARGLAALPWDTSARQLLQRARLAAEYRLAELPELSTTALEAQLPQWLGPFLGPDSRLEQLPWQPGLEYYLGYELCERLSRWLPIELGLPSGRRIDIDYPDEELPQISAKLQEFFGCQALTLGDGKIPLRIHLTSPNGSPLAITTDLASFWQQAYPEVRKQMRGRYPKHPWPADPLNHSATRLTKKRLSEQGGA